mgnify:CR=1 FL=1
MKTQHFQWILLVGCVLALGWQHKTIGNLQDSLSAQGIQTGDAVSGDEPVRVESNTRKGLRGGSGRMLALESRIAILEKRGRTFVPTTRSAEQDRSASTRIHRRRGNAAATV